VAALSGGIADAGSDRFSGHGSADVARFKQVENTIGMLLSLHKAMAVLSITANSPLSTS